MNKIKFIFLILLCFLFLPSFALDKNTEKLNYDFSSTNAIPIRLSVLKEIKTSGGLIDGTEIELRVLNNVFQNGEIIVKKDDIAKAKIEMYITKGMNGFPAEIIIDDYEINNIDSSKIIGTYKKAGANRCYWVFPLKWALTPLPPTGSLTNFILGGEAKITPRDVITVYYFPEWK